jgi:hypothetical protein
MDRTALHQLIDEIPETEAEHLAALVEATRKHDRLAVQTLLAEEVPAENDELAALAEIDRSEPTISIEELERRHGMT